LKISWYNVNMTDPKPPEETDDLSDFDRLMRRLVGVDPAEIPASEPIAEGAEELVDLMRRSVPDRPTETDEHPIVLSPEERLRYARGKFDLAACKLEEADHDTDDAVLADVFLDLCAVKSADIPERARTDYERFNALVVRNYDHEMRDRVSLMTAGDKRAIVSLILAIDANLQGD